jgi:predicted nuclease of restriction endonuclease-like (RecB) superfamily
MNNIKTTQEYIAWLKSIKSRIAAARVKAALSANRELIELYWYLGCQIMEKQKTAKWGSGFIDQFSKDLTDAFPDIAGFSPKNLRYCRAFYNFYNHPLIWQQIVAKLKDSHENEKWQQTVAKTDSIAIKSLKSQIATSSWGSKL